MKEEEKASGIECHLSRLEKALEEIAAAAAEDTVENDKKKTDNAKAAEMRNRGCRKPERNTGKAAERRGGRSETKAKKAVEVEVTQLHICVTKIIAFRSGKKENCLLWSRLHLLRVFLRLFFAPYDGDLSPFPQVHDLAVLGS